MERIEIEVLAENTAELLNMSVVELKRQIHNCHIAAEHCCGWSESVSGLGGTDYFYHYVKDGEILLQDGKHITYEDKLKEYFERILLKRFRYNPHILKAYLHCSWWRGQFTHPSIEDVLSEINYSF